MKNLLLFVFIVIFITVSLFFLFRKEEKNISDVIDYKYDIEIKKDIIKRKFIYNHQN